MRHKKGYPDFIDPDLKKEMEEIDIWLSAKDGEVTFDLAFSEWFGDEAENVVVYQQSVDDVMGHLIGDHVSGGFDEETILPDRPDDKYKQDHNLDAVEKAWEAALTRLRKARQRGLDVAVQEGWK